MNIYEFMYRNIWDYTWQNWMKLMKCVITYELIYENLIMKLFICGSIYKYKILYMEPYITMYAYMISHIRSFLQSKKLGILSLLNWKSFGKYIRYVKFIRVPSTFKKEKLFVSKNHSCMTLYIVAPFNIWNNQKDNPVINFIENNKIL